MRALWPAALVGTVAGVAVALGLATSPIGATDEAPARENAGRPAAMEAVTTYTGATYDHDLDFEQPPSSLAPAAEPEGASMRPLGHEGPQTLEEVPAWRADQRSRMQDELAERMGVRMRADGVPDDRIDMLMEAVFAQRDALVEAGE